MQATSLEASIMQALVCVSRKSVNHLKSFLCDEIETGTRREGNSSTGTNLDSVHSFNGRSPRVVGLSINPQIGEVLKDNRKARHPYLFAPHEVC